MNSNTYRTGEKSLAFLVFMQITKGLIHPMVLFSKLDIRGKINVLKKTKRPLLLSGFGEI